MNPHCFSPRVLASFFLPFPSLLKAPHALSAGLYPRIFGRTLTTYIPVAVLHEEHPTLPVSLALLPLPAPCRRFPLSLSLSLPLSLSLSLPPYIYIIYMYIYVYTCVRYAGAHARVSRLSSAFARVYTYVYARREPLSVTLLISLSISPSFSVSLSLYLALSLPTFLRSFSDPLPLQHRCNPAADFSPAFLPSAPSVPRLWRKERVMEEFEGGGRETVRATRETSVVCVVAYHAHSRSHN